MKHEMSMDNLESSVGLSSVDWNICTFYLMHVVLHVIQIREFEYSPEAQETRKQDLENLMQNQETLRGSLLQWCYTSYGEVSMLALSFSSYIGSY